MTRQLIAVDIDDVVADSTEALRLSVNKRYGANLQPEDYVLPDDGNYWGYYERVWARHGLHMANYDELHEDMAIDQSHITLVPGVEQALKQLSRAFDVILVTSRDQSWEKATVAWLDDHLAGLYHDVHFAGRANHHAQTKGKLCRRLGVSVLIDDNPEHCRSAIEHGVDAILFGSFGWHNRKRLGLTVCKDWAEVLRYFDGRE